jgi:tRNA A-37 threonylcarbamoyl transferase component Bud32
MAGPGRRPPTDQELLAQADRAERGGEVTAAAAALRATVGRNPDDARLRLRFARLLTVAGERAAARQALSALEAPGARSPPPELAPEIHRAFAELDEADGLLRAAALRWEQVLADDIDDAQARARLRLLRPQQGPLPGGPAETLLSPEGLETLRYRLRGELGRGATAAVYLATDESLGIDVALKVLHPQLASAARAGARERFFAEARVAAAIRHPGVVAIYDVDDTARALSMEYVAGGTLRARLRERAAASADEITSTAASLLEALAHVHERGVVHGDIKPSNLLLRAPGTVVLADFGAAELQAAERGASPPVTMSSADGPAGTPQYLAPEQFRGARPSPGTDLYAAGAVLWEMATGRPLRGHADLLRGALDSVSLPPGTRLALGPTLTALIASLIGIDPAARPPSARAALGQLLGQ